MLLREAKEILEKNGYNLNEAVKGVYISVLGDLYETDDLQKVREIFKKRLIYYIDKFELCKAREMIDKLDALDNGEIEYYRKGGTKWIQCDEHGNEI